LFVAARRPARLLALDMSSALPASQVAADTDDMWYDANRKRSCIPGGERFIRVYQQIDPDCYERITKIRAAIGARVPIMNRLGSTMAFIRLFQLPLIEVRNPITGLRSRIDSSSGRLGGEPLGQLNHRDSGDVFRAHNSKVVGPTPTTKKIFAFNHFREPCNAL
jgi:hypothetical protein